ncbi:putative cytochrome-b5 reductase [Helianthus annuus]|uniref:NADH-cytochrome b5 reductase n=1 Tax=Helianthus annuus TaxID=4232 RepID=A0A251T3H1_HELAN|nr:NADH--cytochrome b5 reductase 1 [Helianthus annuus]KAF5821115.1 putative cytochrome-b5 reductase [Helianthus annuus]KAJ0610833.1 putative cytochrome-b5 reductase [Helianthus annuus]KAJ0621658.1 putative cytochrome-b5 reductase [Helianthus annuus]KAJ0626081.1 putative cytochrome-b5 reductase [Helianthus annuus]KAJ0808903.1 putative cytochrome-b5 reductase [Helianthus annuus]
MDFLEEHEIPIVISVFSVSIVAFLLFSKKPKGCIDPDKYRDFKLVKRTQLSHNVAKFRFALPTPSSVLGLPIGQHIICRGTDSQGQEITKPYTPTTLDTDAGYFELVIKMYPQGRMSHHFREMKEGDYLSVKGPKGEFKYRPGDARAFGMLAGGSGITPMFQVARAILEDESDKTKLDLIYANVTVDDILLKEELDTLATKYYGRFKVYYVLEQPPEGWTGGVGFISKEMIEEHLPEPAFDIKILRCGPPAMNKAMAGHLEALGYEPRAQFQF